MDINEEAKYCKKSHGKSRSIYRDKKNTIKVLEMRLVTAEALKSVGLRQTFNNETE